MTDNQKLGQDDRAQIAEEGRAGECVDIEKTMKSSVTSLGYLPWQWKFHHKNRKNTGQVEKLRER